MGDSVTSVGNEFSTRPVFLEGCLVFLGRRDECSWQSGDTGPVLLADGQEGSAATVGTVT